MLVATSIVLAAFGPHGGHAIECTDVVRYITPCNPYVTGRGAIGTLFFFLIIYCECKCNLRIIIMDSLTSMVTLLGLCCNGIQGLYGAAQSTPDRQSVCNCLKSLTNDYSSDEIYKAAGLPHQCGVNLPYKIDPSTDCSRYK